MKKMIFMAAAAVMCAASLTACGKKNYADGTYTGQSAEYVNTEDGSDNGNGYGVVSLTIKDNKITECEFKTYELDGKLKDKDYGSAENKDFYRKAQKAVLACDEYAKSLVEKGDIDKVDAISGATINYGEFKEAVGIALSQAEEK